MMLEILTILIFYSSSLRNSQSISFSSIDSTYNLSDEINFRSLESVDGNLEFKKSSGGMIPTLKGITTISFENVTKIEGNLIFSGSWEGGDLYVSFDNLKEVGGGMELSIENQEGANLFLSFPSLESVNGSLTLKGENLNGHEYEISKGTVDYILLV